VLFRSDTVSTVRRFRDSLRTTRKGRAYLELSEKNIGYVTRVLDVLKKDASIREEAANAIKPFIKAVDSMHELKPRILKKEEFDAAIAVLDKIAKADPELKPAVKSIKREAPRYMGKSVKQTMLELS